MTEFNQNIKRTNLLVPYIGTYYSVGNDGRNRISFIKPIKDIFEHRKKIRGIDDIWFIGFNNRGESVEYITLWDHLPIYKKGLLYYVKFSKKGTRFNFPKEIIVPEGQLVWRGQGDHIQIWRAEDFAKSDF